MRTNEKHMQPALFILKHLSGSPTVSADEMKLGWNKICVKGNTSPGDLWVKYDENTVLILVIFATIFISLSG